MILGFPSEGTERLGENLKSMRFSAASDQRPSAAGGPGAARAVDQALQEVAAFSSNDASNRPVSDFGRSGAKLTDPAQGEAAQAPEPGTPWRAGDRPDRRRHDARPAATDPARTTWHRPTAMPAAPAPDVASQPAPASDATHCHHPGGAAFRSSHAEPGAERPARQESKTIHDAAFSRQCRGVGAQSCTPGGAHNPPLPRLDPPDDTAHDRPAPAVQRLELAPPLPTPAPATVPCPSPRQPPAKPTPPQPTGQAPLRAADSAASPIGRPHPSQAPPRNDPVRANLPAGQPTAHPPARRCPRTRRPPRGGTPHRGRRLRHPTPSAAPSPDAQRDQLRSRTPRSPDAGRAGLPPESPRPDRQSGDFL